MLVPQNNPRTTGDPTTGDPRSSAEICRERAWDVGTILEGEMLPKETGGPRRIIITAIGITTILAIDVSDEASREEQAWNLHTRDWRRWEPGPSVVQAEAACLGRYQALGRRAVDLVPA